ncbi:DUF6266 family protein [Pedobacter hiemivivus]|uniref:DUF6266 family protein n=1 Tax=Pedobacter hiemivivus TaxID=2530454 RepID=UPI00197E392A|nr:DUF6266 family protein [Pedobacter hiemivivus]
MARIENGILGGFNGNLGPVEGYVRYGIAYVRTKKRKRTTPPTPKEKIQRKRMEVVNNFVNSMTDYVRIGFEEAAQGKPISPNNAAKSYQLLHAVQGEYPDISMNYSAARLTQGTIELPLNPIATAEGNGVRFNWSYNTSLNWSDRGARVMLLVYAEETGKSYYLFSGARMTEETDFLELPAEVKGMQLQVYMSFIADDRRSLSNSIYLGNLVIETLALNTMEISTEQDSCAILPNRRKEYAEKTASLLHENGKITGLLFDKIIDREGWHPKRQDTIHFITLYCFLIMQFYSCFFE